MHIKVGDKVLATIGYFYGATTTYKWEVATVCMRDSNTFDLRFPNGVRWSYSFRKLRDDGQLETLPMEWVRPLFLKRPLEATE